MSKVLYCHDLGFDCEGVIRADSEAEILKQAAEHAKTVHNLQEITEDVITKLRSVIRTE